MERVFVKLIYGITPESLQDRINEYLGALINQDLTYWSADIIKDGEKSGSGYLAIIKYYSEKEVKE